jgi:hypothetical protein
MSLLSASSWVLVVASFLQPAWDPTGVMAMVFALKTGLFKTDSAKNCKMQSCNKVRAIILRTPVFS